MSVASTNSASSNAQWQHPAPEHRNGYGQARSDKQCLIHICDPTPTCTEKSLLKVNKRTLHSPPRRTGLANVIGNIEVEQDDYNPVVKNTSIEGFTPIPNLRRGLKRALSHPVNPASKRAR